MSNFHTPVLLKEVIEGLRVQPGKRYIDATVGGGGHAIEILRRGGIVLGLDVDQEAIEYAQERIKNLELRIKNALTLAQGNFRDIDKIAHLKNFGPRAGGVAGIIFDLGVSSHQLETPQRGFSLQREGPLDMRMDKSLAVKALDLIQALNKGELYEIFTKLGEEGTARTISEHIIRARSVSPIKTTAALAKLMRPNARAKIFQALRIAVNDELHAIQEALPKALELLSRNGRLLVISFHSLEDRIVKQSFIKFENEKRGKIITEKPILPAYEEIAKNKRARSAKLRIYEKI